MKSAVRIVGMAVYGISVSYSLWLIWCFLLPRLMAMERILVSTYLFVGVLFLGVSSGIGALLAVPLCRASGGIYDYILPLVAFLIGGSSALTLSWKFLGSDTVLSMLAVFVVDSYLLALYGTLVVALIKNNRQRG